MEIKSVFELLAFVASIASLLLAVVAIWLSIVFYRLSSEASKSTTEAAKGIAASVERLEKLFDKLYSDTFSMMRDTVADMRKHMWPEDDTSEHENALAEVERKTDGKVAELKKTMETQLQSVLAEQKLGQEENKAIQSKMRRLLDQAMRASRSVDMEAREETIREHILRTIGRFERSRGQATVEEVMGRLSDTFFPPRIITEIKRLREENLIQLSPDVIAPNSVLKVRVERAAVAIE